VRQWLCAKFKVPGQQGLRTSLGYLSALGKSISPRSYSPAGRETDVFCTIDRQDNSIFSGTSTP
jgi:hypothetical protein